MWWGLDAGKYFWRSGREKCFSLDIPFNRTSGLFVNGHNPERPRVIECKRRSLLREADYTSITYFSSVVTRGTIPSVLHATVPDQPY